MKTKLCKSCQKTKPLSDFYVRKSDGWVFARCKTCYLQADKRRGPNADPKHRKHDSKRKRDWRKKHPEYDRAQFANRRARRFNADGQLTPQQVKDVWAEWNGVCWVCGRNATQLDHFQPINKKSGGTNTPDNIRPICSECNHKRSYIWYGYEKAEAEAKMIKQIQDMLHGSTSAELAGSEGDG